MVFFRIFLFAALLLGPSPAQASLWKDACARLFGRVEAIPAKPARLRFESGSTYPSIQMQEKFVGENQVDVYGKAARDPVRYFKDQTRKTLEIAVDENGLLRKADGKLLNTCYPATTDCPAAIFVMDEKGKIYVYSGDYFTENMELIFHSSLSAGKPVASAGEIFVKEGKLLEINNRSGHYLPSMEVFGQVIAELEARGVSTAETKVVKALKDPK